MKRNRPTKKVKAPKLRVKKGDTVKVITGVDNGITGKVLQVIPEKMRLIVEGVNIRKRHMRPTQDNPEGRIIEREMPIHYSNVMLLDESQNPTRVGIRVEGEGDSKRKVRVALTTGNEI